MSESDDLLDDFEDDLESTVEYHQVTKKRQNKKKVELRRLIEARNELAMLVDEQRYFMKLDLDSDSPLV